MYVWYMCVYTCTCTCMYVCVHSLFKCSRHIAQKFTEWACSMWTSASCNSIWTYKVKETTFDFVGAKSWNFGNWPPPCKLLLALIELIVSCSAKFQTTLQGSVRVCTISCMWMWTFMNVHVQYRYEGSFTPYVMYRYIHICVHTWCVHILLHIPTHTYITCSCIRKYACCSCREIDLF